MEEKHESDLTPKERRLLEWEKFKKMNVSQKLEYFWDYYKWTLLVAAIVIFFIAEGIGIYHRLQEIKLLSIAIMDVPIDRDREVEQFRQDLLAAIGNGIEHEKIELDTSLMSGDTVAAVSKLTVVVGGGLTDVLICNEETYLNLEEQGAFTDWTEILGEEYEEYQTLFTPEGRLDLSDLEIWNSYALTSYSPVYLGRLDSSSDMEYVRRFIHFLSGKYEKTASDI